MNTLVRALYQLARALNDLNSLSSPGKAARRVKNKLVGRGLGKAGFWKGLWK